MISYATPIRKLISEADIPLDFLASPDGALAPVLDKLFFTGYALIQSPDGFGAVIDLVVAGEAALSLPGLDGFAFVIGSDGDGATLIDASVFVTSQGFSARLDNVTVALRFPPTILKPVPETPGAAPPPYAQIEVHGSVIFENGDLRFDGFDALTLKPVMISDSGIIISAEDVKLDFSRTDTLPEIAAAGFDESFMGVFIGEAKVHLPEGLPDAAPEDLVLHNCAIGSGGVSGRIEFHYTPVYDPTTQTFSGRGSGALFGIPFAMADVVLDIHQNALRESQITGSLVLPYFEERVDVELGFNLGGGFTARLTASSGLLTLSKPGILNLTVESLGFRLDAGYFTTVIGGRIQPDVAGLDWPTFEVKELAIDSHGNVKLEGGWIDLRDGYSLDFHGFKVEITKIGFGKNDDGGKWIGFSGGLNLVDGFSAGASVEGLKVTWYEDGSHEPKISLDGVGVEMTIPNAVSFKGHVSYRELVDAQGETVHQFDGDIKLKLLALDLEVDGVLVIGSALKPDAHSYTFFAIYVSAELPAGIPLWSTGLALYALAGLFALQLEPDKHANEEWYGIGPGDGWYKRPNIGVTDLVKKWRNEEGSLALGGGLTIGTVADNGFTFSGRMVLVLAFPGPILMIEGKANMLKERSKLSDEPIFRALAVLDERAGTLLFGLDAQYKAGSNGELIDIRGGVEAFFDFHDHNRWHLYLGLKDPREKRIRAQLFKLFESNAYFMADAHTVQTGAWVGYNKNWHYGPVKITLEAWVETNAALSTNPVHFHGDLWEHGKVAMRVFGFGFGMSLDAKLAGDVFEPFHILADLSVELDLPWPLPNVDVDIRLEWGPEPTPPPIPMVLKELAIEHFKVTTSWPLPRASLLLPNYDQDGFIGPPVGPSIPADLNAVPVVPLDCRPHITFGRPVHDAALVGNNPQPPNPSEERIGDPSTNEGPARVKYTLRAVTLEKFTGGTWTAVARKADTPNPPGLPELFGSWAPVPAAPGGSNTPSVGQVKLWIWSKNPFDYTRGTSGSWDEWFTSQFTTYPCIPDAPSKSVCCDFTRYRIGSTVELPHSCDPEMLLLCFPPSRIQVERLRPQSEGIDRAACFPPESSLQVRFTRPAHHIDILLESVSEADVQAIAALSDGSQLPLVRPQEGHIIIEHEGVMTVTVRGKFDFCVIRVCADLGPDPNDVLERQEMEQHLQSATALWSQTGAVLEPNTIYRLKVLTRAEATGEGELAGWNNILEQEETGFFRTEGPPGLTDLAVPVNEPNPDTFDSGLTDLVRYVEQTVPPTVPPAGQKPLLPKPVYRAYDVGVAFNEDYVDLMYRIAGRDLGLYLFDNNNVPLRDAAGRLIVRPNTWGHVETLTFDASEQRWIQVVNGSTCAVIDVTTIPQDVKLTAGSAEQVLTPDAVHEARLMPLLLHESFGKFNVSDTTGGPAGTLGRWQVVDQGISQGPSQWQIAETPAPVTRYIVQTTNIWGGTTDGTDPIKPGSMLILGADPNLPATDSDQPNLWTDYRLTAFLCNEDDDAIGVVFRYVDANNYYRFSMDAERKYRRLVRVIHGIHTILCEDDRRYQRNVDYGVTVEAIGPSLKVYIDGELILETTDASHVSGSIGLYCWASQNARFFDIAIDDFRKVDPVSKQPSPVYRFQFTTSKFAHFTHHVHSFDDKTYIGALVPGTGTQAWVASASLPDVPITDDESRAYDALARAVLGTGADSFPKSLEFTRVEQNGNTVGFLAQTSEPFDWTRLDLQVSSAPTGADMPIVAPDILKMISVSFATNLPREEAVSLVTRDSLDLRGHAVEAFLVPGPIKAADPSQYLSEDFGQDGLGLLFEETFGPNALDRYTIVDQGTVLGPSAWSISGSAIRQTSHIGGGALDGTELSQPGTMAITGDPNWTDVRIKARLLSTDINGIGLVIRYKDSKNYYRFSTDNRRNFRRLVKCVGGVFTLLWEDASNSYAPNVAFDLQIDVFGNRLIGLVDSMVLFDVTDDSFKMGQVGLYSWMNADSVFQALRVQSLDFNPIFLKPDLGTLDGWLKLDPADAIDGPSAWSAGASGISQASRIRVAGPEKFGAHLVTGKQWDDMQLSVDLKSTEDGAVGVLIRYRDKQNYYRFSMDRAEGYRRLEKCVNGTMSTLWQGATGFELNQTYRLSLQAKGSVLKGFLDGQQIFLVVDNDLAIGSVGLYTWDNGGASFDRLWVLSLADAVGSFLIFDGQGLAGASAWRTRFGELQQRSVIGDAAAPKLGTHAIAPVDVPSVMRLVVEARSDSDTPIGVLFRWQNERNYYRLSASTADHVQQLMKVVDGVATILWQVAGGYAPGSTHLFTVDTFGERLVGYIDDEKLFDVQDSSLLTGRVGLYTSRNDSAAFASVEVTTPPIEANTLFMDQFGENNVADWTFVSEATVGGPPNWAATDGVLAQTSAAFKPPPAVQSIPKQGVFAVAGDAAWGDIVFRARLQSNDQNAIGVMFRYQDQNHYYRFSMDRNQQYRRLVKNVGGTFKLLWQDDFAFEIGHSYEIVIVASGNQLWGYFDGVQMFAVEDSDLPSGQVGLYCWRNPGARFSCVAVLPIEAAFTDWAFKDNFPYLVVGRWAFVDAGTADAPSKWSVKDSRLLQSSSISGASPHEGTYAVSARGSRDWPDYRFTASMASSTDGVIGLAVRYQDAENHYRFEIGSGAGGRRLVKVVAGIETELWSDAKGYTKTEPILATLECVGRRIACYVNGVKVCEVDDDAFSKGRVALFTFKNSGAAFNFVRVQESAWQSYYRFGKIPTCPAGHRIRVLACAESVAPPALPNVHDVFVAGPGEQGNVHFFGSSCDLRIVDPLGKVQHTRTFLRSSRYAPIADFKVLRRPDGCGFFVALPAAVPEGSRFPQAQYRLKLTYRLDNTAIDSSSQIQREAGASDPETTQIDVPW